MFSSTFRSTHEPILVNCKNICNSIKSSEVRCLISELIFRLEAKEKITNIDLERISNELSALGADTTSERRAKNILRNIKNNLAITVEIVAESKKADVSKPSFSMRTSKTRAEQALFAKENEYKFIAGINELLEKIHRSIRFNYSISRVFICYNQSSLLDPLICETIDS